MPLQNEFHPWRTAQLLSPDRSDRHIIRTKKCFRIFIKVQKQDELASDHSRVSSDRSVIDIQIHVHAPTGIQMVFQHWSFLHCDHGNHRTYGVPLQNRRCYFQSNQEAWQAFRQHIFQSGILLQYPG